MSTASNRISQVEQRILQIKEREESAIAESNAQKQETYRDLVKQWALAGDDSLDEDALLEFLKGNGRSIETFHSDVKAAIDTRKGSLMVVTKQDAIVDHQYAGALFSIGMGRRDGYRIEADNVRNMNATSHWNTLHTNLTNKVAKLEKNSRAFIHADWTDCKADEALIEVVRKLTEQVSALRLSKYQLLYEIERIGRINHMDWVDFENLEKKGNPVTSLTHAIKSRLEKHRAENKKIAEALQAEVGKVSAQLQEIENQLSEYVD